MRKLRPQEGTCPRPDGLSQDLKTDFLKTVLLPILFGSFGEHLPSDFRPDLNLKFSLKHNILHLLLKGQNQSSRFSRGNTDPSTCPSASLSEHSSKPKSLNRCIHAHIHMCSLRRPSLPLISGLFSLTWKPHRPGGYPDCHFGSINGR